MALTYKYSGVLQWFYDLPVDYNMEILLYTLIIQILSISI